MLQPFLRSQILKPQIFLVFICLLRLTCSEPEPGSSFVSSNLFCTLLFDYWLELASSMAFSSVIAALIAVSWDCAYYLDSACFDSSSAMAYCLASLSSTASSLALSSAASAAYYRVLSSSTALIIAFSSSMAWSLAFSLAASSAYFRTLSSSIAVSLAFSASTASTLTYSCSMAYILALSSSMALSLAFSAARFSILVAATLS